MIRIYTQDEIKRVFDSGMMSYNTHMYLKDYIEDGISTYELDCLANDYIVKNGGVCLHFMDIVSILGIFVFLLMM